MMLTNAALSPLTLPLHVDFTRLKTRTLFISWTQPNFGNKAFSAAGPRVWNYLPTDLRQPDLSCSQLRQSLKTLYSDSGTKVQ